MTSILAGMISYAPQKHLVAGKIYARDNGPNDKVTRQPNKGRAK